MKTTDSLLGQRCEPVARVPNVAREKIFLVRGIYCCPSFSFRPTSLRDEYICIGLYIGAGVAQAV
jgi:hypothetical protein